MVEFQSSGIPLLDERQREIDDITPGDYEKYRQASGEELDVLLDRFPALKRLESAFDKLYRELNETEVSDINHPAIWYLYNMGLVVKTADRCFSVDLHHRRAEELAGFLDFALITHNHGDHYTQKFLAAMDGAGKTVVQNFYENGGAKQKGICGYLTEYEKEFTFGSIRILADRCDHNSMLIKYTTPFEIHIGDFTLFHSGDCCNHKELQPERQPDLWVLHPYCGMNPLMGCREITPTPKKVVVAHLQELAHARDRWRWTYSDGMKIVNCLEAAGYPAIMPLWGDRIF